MARAVSAMYAVSMTAERTSLLGYALICATAMACDANAPGEGVTARDGGLVDGASTRGDAGADHMDAGGEILAVVNPPDPEGTRRGWELLNDDRWPGTPVLPKLALDNLWVVWGTGPVDETTKWSEIESRYGLTRRPGEPWPVGLTDPGGPSLSFNCLLCHASRGTEPGEMWIGVGNARLNLERLYDDLVALNRVADRLGLGSLPVAYDLRGSSGGPGAVDGVGLGLRFAGTIDDLGETFGYQQAPAWWTLRYKERLYTDGSGRVDNWRTMMSTLFAFGLSQAEIQSHDAEFQDLREAMLALEPPAWPFAAPASEAVERGKVVFDRHCASCHGSYGEGARFPDLVILTEEVGTDPVREAGLDDTQASVINASWYGEPARWTASDGYLAPPLVGVWATAPYLHNGSIPDLESLLDSGQRLTRWRYVDGGRAYDPTRMGWRVEEATGGDARSVYDTTRRGLSNAGHVYGDGLDGTERSNLLAYLKTL